MVASMLSTLTALIVLGVPLGFVLAQRNYREVVLALQREATAAQRLVPENLADASSMFKPTDGDEHVALYDSEGVRIAGHGPVRADRVVSVAKRTRLPATGKTATQLVVAMPVDVGGDFLGVIRAAESLDELRRRDRIGWIVLGSLGIAATGAAAMAGMVLARRLIGPAEDLREDARRLGEGDFTVRRRATGVAELDDISTDLSRAAGRLDRALSRERSFSADASHQLRTPIASLRLAIETELITPSPDPSGALRDLLDDVDRLEQTTSSLLALARDTHSDRQKLDVRELFCEAMSRVALPRRAGRSLDADVEGNMSAPLASKSAIAQVIDVLVDNAFRHGTGQVTLRARAAGPNGAVLAVCDEGVNSIDERLFDARRLDTARGTGIGLALARRLVETEGGQLRLAVREPHTCFEIVLPTG